jgi:hypothetical protein
MRGQRAPRRSNRTWGASAIAARWALAAIVAALAGPGPIGALASLGPIGGGPALAGAHERGRAARTISLNESGRLRLTSKRGFTLNEMGTASGTIHGTIYIHLRVASLNHVTAEVNIYPHGGSISGHASASYHVAGPTASFSGTMSVARGTGSYAHAHASGLSFSGTIKRSNDAVTVRLSGRLST